MSTRLDPITTRDELTDHPRYRYRGCAPDVDQPRMAAGDLRLPVGAWQGPDMDGGEDQNDRRVREAAAIEVCVSCPVMVQCLAYGSSVTADGKLAEQHAILGGMTALERHRAFVKKRHEVTEPAPDGQLRTKQKLAVLKALAAHTDPYEVAAAAAMDVRTANWQRSILVTKLSLQRDATRRELLAEASRRGLLDGVAVVDDDGTVPAVPAPTKMLDAPAPSTVDLFAPDPLPSWGPSTDDPSVAEVPEAPDGEDTTAEPVRVRAPRRDRFAAIVGQLSIEDLDSEAAISLFLTHSVPLEAAA